MMDSDSPVYSIGGAQGPDFSRRHYRANRVQDSDDYEQKQMEENVENKKHPENAKNKKPKNRDDDEQKQMEENVENKKHPENAKKKKPMNRDDDLQKEMEENVENKKHPKNAKNKKAMNRVIITVQRKNEGYHASVGEKKERGIFKLWSKADRWGKNKNSKGAKPTLHGGDSLSKSKMTSATRSTRSPQSASHWQTVHVDKKDDNNMSSGPFGHVRDLTPQHLYNQEISDHPLVASSDHSLIFPGSSSSRGKDMYGSSETSITNSDSTESRKDIMRRPKRPTIRVKSDSTQEQEISFSRDVSSMSSSRMTRNTFVSSLLPALCCTPEEYRNREQYMIDSPTSEILKENYRKSPRSSKSWRKR